MTPQSSLPLDPDQVAELIASAPPSSPTRIRALSIDKSSEAARKHLTNSLASLCQMEVQINLGQRLDQGMALDLTGLTQLLHGKLGALLHHNADRAPPPPPPPPPSRPPPGEPERRGPHRAPPFPAHGAAAPPPPPVAREKLFKLYTPAPPPATPPRRFDEAEVTPCSVLETGCIANAGNEVEPLQAAIMGIYEPPGSIPWYMGINLDEPLALGAFGAPGSGKTYIKGVLVESFLMNIRGIHLHEAGLQQPGCVIALRVGEGPEIPLDHLAAIQGNHNHAEAVRLWAMYLGRPKALQDLVILCLPEEVAAYRERYPYALVLPIQMSLKSLSALGFNGLMGVHKGRSPLYLRALGKSLRALRSQGQGGLLDLRKAVQGLHLTGDTGKLAQHRLDLIEPFIDEDVDLQALVKAGRLIQISISTASLVPEDARLLAALLLDILVLREGGERCPLLVDLDEAHTLLDHQLLEQVVETLLRRRRHLRTGTILCTHSPKAIRKDLLSLLDAVAVFRSDDPDSLKHLGEALSIFKSLDPALCARLKEGTAWWWASRYYQYDEEDSSKMTADVLIQLETRPRVSHHGGATRKAVEPSDDRQEE